MTLGTGFVDTTGEFCLLRFVSRTFQSRVLFRTIAFIEEMELRSAFTARKTRFALLVLAHVNFATAREFL